MDLHHYKNIITGFSPFLPVDDSINLSNRRAAFPRVRFHRDTMAWYRSLCPNKIMHLKEPKTHKNSWYDPHRHSLLLPAMLLLVLAKELNGSGEIPLLDWME